MSYLKREKEGGMEQASAIPDENDISSMEEFLKQHQRGLLSYTICDGKYRSLSPAYCPIPR